MYLITSPARWRTVLALGAAALAAADLALKAWAEDALAQAPVGPGFAQLRLAHNSGVAFSMGAELPAWTVIGFTGLITAALAVLAWRTAARSQATAAALAVVLAGAAANLVDRAAHGAVTDYLHTGWWPTFNLADVFVCCGGLAVVALSWRHPAPAPQATTAP
ncbi:signal peptidase II [Streptomyces sp. NBC_00249]|uniref:signal peptidase II n=1 Tax=Streptomyces sp. NBC_00249 TaxID=2975690 RepID=UPI0022514FC3|nr:signal peptidase II [Streptomyces sp. NBC_00249]MCX5192490.1 signal peptidase II [Streptomyces sp. NBC_00249]